MKIPHSWTDIFSKQHAADDDADTQEMHKSTFVAHAEEYIVRPFEFRRDADAVCGFQNDTYTLNFDDFEYTDAFARAFRHHLRRASLSDTNGVFVLQHYSDEIVGFLWLVIYRNEWTGNPYGYVNNLYVAPQHRGRGLGHRLMQQTDAFFSVHDVHDIRLSVTITNEAAMHLYKAHGFEVTRWEMEKKADVQR